MQECPHCESAGKQAGVGYSECPLLNAAYVFAGLAMMLNIRLSYSSAPYALIRFRLPENLFSVFVRRMASALELWCLPSMLLGNIVEYALKGHYLSQGYKSDGDWGTYNGNLKKPSTINIQDTGSASTTKTIIINNLPNIKDPDLKSAREDKFYAIIVPSIVTQWLNFLTYVILLVVYLIGGDQGYLTTFYFVIAISGFVFGINMVLLYAVDWNYIPIYMVGENSFPIVTSFMHYVTTLIFGNRRKWNSDFIIVMIDILVAIIISLVAAVVWTYAYGNYTDTKITAITDYTAVNNKQVTIKDCSATPQVIGTTSNNASITSPDNPGATLTITDITPTANAGNALQAISSAVNASIEVATDNKTLTIKYDGGKCITIILGSTATETITKAKTPVPYGHIFTETFDMNKVHWEIISPTLMVIVGMGLVYSIYPGIAPGMIVPFYLVDKIEMVLLIATFFPPIIVATLQLVDATKGWSPKTRFAGPGIGMGGWKEYEYTDYSAGGTKKPVNAYFYHAFDLLIVIKITLAVIFIYCLHYRDSNISRSIVNQPKMSTALSITFYMCHECLLALGFPGMVGNNGTTYVMLPAQYVGALFMIFLAFYSEGYIIEYKSHDPANWPTTGMTPWNAFCYWAKRASKITNHNLESLFTNDLKIFIF